MKPRIARPDDLAAVVALTDAAYAPWTPLLGAPPVPVTEDYAPRIERGEVWLLEEGTETAGLIVLERHADHAMIFSVAVSPAFQRRGLALAMLKWSEEQARAWAVPEIRLFASSKMERNLAIYQTYGFHETGRGPHPYRQGWTIVNMAKSIGPIAA
ncbi:acetyltransferase [Mesorhizobium sp. Root157]|uniref:GNAT family N-acetyltransferase n=1 Tax=Mesorhizobium sp. Root157 TaxID=1736477 RepID=UPI0006F550AC|nr:GNAT family N-acetyltransferase [Mesorhizobium sp. Root157]KQZ78163.1 acetyltransferase [Mesorhizobium sp. Root157]